MFAQIYESDPYGYNYSVPGDTTMDSAMTAAVVATVVLIMLIIALAVYVVSAIMLGQIFKKAGEKPWKAWVPVYNNWVMLELGGQKGWWAVIMLIPIVNIVAAVFMILAMYQIGINFGKDGAFVLLGIFLPLVWLIWLAVDGSTWKGKQTLPKQGEAARKPVS